MFKKDRHIKEEPEDQRRPWESRKVENKCKVSFVRESGYFLRSGGTGLTDQNRSSLVQYYALAVDSTSFRKKLLHHSCLLSHYITTSPSSLAGKLLTERLASPQSQSESAA